MIQKIKTFIHQSLIYSLCALLICGQLSGQVFAQSATATPIPQPLTQFLDQNGNPLSSGFVETFIPNTSTHVTTYQDINQTIPNSNPLTLDAAGRAKIFGNGSFRMKVSDNIGNLVYDYITNSPNPGGSIIVTGDGDLVGTVKAWSGLIAPNQYAFAAGQAISRTNFSVLFTAITLSTSINCTSGSPVLTGIADTSQIPNGAAIESSCIPANSTVSSTTSSTVTINNNALVTTSVTAKFFPYGNGDGSTTFNLPDLRGFTIAGRPNMNGTASTNLTAAFFGTNPQSIGAKGGSQSAQLALPNLPSFKPGLILNDPGHSHTLNNATNLINNLGANNQFQSGIAGTPVTVTTASATTGITLTSLNQGGSGAALNATLVAGGSGYTNGAQVLTVSGGTCITQPQFNVTVASNIVTSINSVATAGNCSIPPTNPVSVTGGGGTGATLNVSFTAQNFATIQPTITLNYIIKITPDISAIQASGVSSLGGMIGAINCGTGLLCTGNNISVSGFPWNLITSTPTTLAGYGIINARTQFTSNPTFYVNGNSTTTNATTAAGNNTLHFAGGSGTTNATTAAGNNVLHFATVPASIYFGATISDATASVVPANTTVTGITKTTVTLSANVTGGGVGSGDTIQWSFHAFKVGMRIADGTVNIPAGTTISSITPTTIVLSANVTGSGVANGDTFVAQATCGITGAETCNFGIDSNDCLSAATACLTLQHVADLVGFTYDLAGFGVTVSLAHGASTNYAVSFTTPVIGKSTWSIFGDQNAPTAVTILSPASSSAVFVKDLGTLGLINLACFNNPAGTGVGCIHAGVGSPGGIDATNITFGALSTGSAFSVSYTGSRITVNGTCTFLGDVPVAFQASEGGLIDVSGASCSGVSGLNFLVAFAVESGGGIISPNASSWISAFPSATGTRFLATDEATFGNVDPNSLFPGSVDGVIATITGALGVQSGAGAASVITYGNTGQFLTSGGGGLNTWDNVRSHLTAGSGISLSGTTTVTITNTSAPCTVTAGAVQYNNAGALGCVTGATSSGAGISFAAGSLALTGAGSGNFTSFGASGVVQDSGKALPTGTVVGTSDTQALTNKTIDCASNTCTNFPTRQTVGSGTTGTLAAGTTDYLGIQGGFSANQLVGVTVGVNVTAKNMYFNVGNAPAGSDTYTITLMTGTYGSASLSATSVTCTITGAATTCNDATHTATLTARQAYAIRVVSSATAASMVGGSWGLELDNP